MSDKSPIINRLPRVKARTGYSGSSIYSMMAAGEFPRPVRLGKRAVGWLEHEIDEWIAARVAQREGDR